MRMNSDNSDSDLVKQKEKVFIHYVFALCKKFNVEIK
jgi:hypothetical protein